MEGGLFGFGKKTQFEEALKAFKKETVWLATCVVKEELLKPLTLTWLEFK